MEKETNLSITPRIFNQWNKNWSDTKAQKVGDSGVSSNGGKF